MSDYFPYGGTSGWSGTDTSRERALHQDSAGITRRLSDKTEIAVYESGVRGMTWVELSERLGIHHGQASGALSRLHRVGRIRRLTERRDRCKIYVYPAFVNDRPTETFTPRAKVSDHDRIVTWLEKEANNPEVGAVSRWVCGKVLYRIKNYEYLNTV